LTSELTQWVYGKEQMSLLRGRIWFSEDRLPAYPK